MKTNEAVLRKGHLVHGKHVGQAVQSDRLSTKTWLFVKTNGVESTAPPYLLLILWPARSVSEHQDVGLLESHATAAEYSVLGSKFTSVIVSYRISVASDTPAHRANLMVSLEEPIVVLTAKACGRSTCNDHNSGSLTQLTSYVQNQPMNLILTLLLASRREILSRAICYQTPAHRCIMDLIYGGGMMHAPRYPSIRYTATIPIVMPTEVPDWLVA
ncbi:hypothetical protein KCU95_g103, partial [Aureobasidium melanogenum]